MIYDSLVPARLQISRQSLVNGIQKELETSRLISKASGVSPDMAEEAQDSIEGLEALLVQVLAQGDDVPVVLYLPPVEEKVDFIQTGRNLC